MTSSAELWQRFCQYRIVRPELGFSLDVSRVQFSDADLTGLRTKMSTALDAMTRLERGAIANADENRMVGHYWLRAPQLAPTAELTNAIEAAIRDVNDFVSKVHLGQIAGAEGPFTHVLHVGIGGSALGPQLVAQALGSTSDRLTILFVDNTDPDGIDSVLAQLEGKLGRTLVTVVSKSGGTPETRNGTLEIEAAYTKAGLSFAQHAIAITQEGSKLDQTAVNDGWIARFPMWDWVGGRTSVLSTVGLVPAALQGIDTTALLRGAALMDQATREVDPYQNPGAMLAMMWYHCTGGRGLKDMVLLPYKDRLSLLSRYLQQLVMESLGKEFDRAGNAVYQGIAVYGNKGSTDQHAYVQQLRDGVSNFFVTFVQVLCDRAGTSIEVDPQITSGDYLQGFLLGTRSALYEKSRDSITITIEQITPETVGALIALYERAVGLYAELIDVNAYHQPGVEAGKKAAAVVLDLQRKVLDSLPAPGEAATAGELAALLGQPDQVETIFKILEHLALNPSRGVQMVVDASPALTRFSRG